MEGVRRGSVEEGVMGFSRFSSSGVMRVAAGGFVVAVALTGCTGPTALNLPGLGLQTSALNIPEKPALAEKPASAADTKTARSRLNDAATLAAARTNPADAQAVISAASVVRRQGDKAGALAILDSAASPASGDARLLRDRGLLALELGAVSRARDHLQRAVAAGSRDWQTHSGLGVALGASGKPKDAERAFGDALKLAPDNPVVLNNLALALALDGRRGEAEQMLRRAAAASAKGGDARVAQNLALVGRISEGRAKSKEGERSRQGAASQSPAPAPVQVPVQVPAKDVVKDAKKAASAAGPLQTAHAD
jgi:Flp pilus assembly protein TadD